MGAPPIGRYPEVALECCQRDVILLVEDGPVDRESMIRLLRRRGITNDVVTADNGIDALDYLYGTGTFAGRDPSVLPLVMLLDLRLPKIDGLDVLRRVRADLRTKALPVIIVSGSLEEADALQAHALCTSNFIQKPFTVDAFLAALGRLGLLPYLQRPFTALGMLFALAG
jgi:two-component system, response regulator